MDLECQFRSGGNFKYLFRVGDNLIQLTCLHAIKLSGKASIDSSKFCVRIGAVVLKLGTTSGPLSLN